ncbi:MAG: hypothetical protein HUU46_22805 [Candidatus Hydrogenedentes bacterium]|nr:hypothetical protein [Candidatus Hydrogenedentota bacterium]
MKRSKAVTPSSDAIVDEVRAIRADLAARHGNDVEKLCAHLRTIESKYADRVVRPEAAGSSHRRRISKAKH